MDHGADSRAVALLGCGHIAAVHLQALARIRGLKVAAVCDRDQTRAQALARRFGVPRVFAEVGELLAARCAGAVHVLTPPESHHALARQCLEAGVHTLVEKPLCMAAAEARELGELARARNVVLGVNHNLVLHPAVARLRRLLAARRLGRIEHVAVLHNMPLRQLQTGDVSHFMFGSDAAILWEQGVHLFSLVHDLLGPATRVTASADEPTGLPHGVTFHSVWDVALRCERGTAAVRMAFGRTMPLSRLRVVGSDGCADVDLLAGTCALRGKTRWLDFLDTARNDAAVGLHHLRAALAGVTGFGFGLMGLTAPPDAYWRSMAASITAFHAAVAGRGAMAGDAAAGEAVLAMCERTAAAAGTATARPPRPTVPEPGPARAGEVLVLGGTGWIGRRAVARLRRTGRPVTLLVRRPWLLPADLRDGSVRVFAGDAADPAALARACAGAERVLHLATCAGDDPALVAHTMAAAVRAAAEACRTAGVRRLCYASSTAAMWLGRRGPVAGDAPPDAAPGKRGPYSRAKIAAEQELHRQRQSGLDVVILRPAIVVGRDAAPQHSGLGLWVRDNHCVGWGRGRNPLPFVLVDDCAAALVAALDAPAASNRTYALAGPVRPSARDYLAELRARSGRDFRHHPQALLSTWLQELGKHLVKAITFRPRELPSLRDLRSRAFLAELDCSAAERDLQWQPETDRAAFYAAALGPEHTP